MRLGFMVIATRIPVAMTPEQEEIVLDKCFDLVAKLQGDPPTGYVAPWWEFSAVTWPKLPIVRRSAPTRGQSLQNAGAGGIGIAVTR